MMKIIGFVDQAGYPFDFDFYDGSTFEGHAFQKAIQALIKKHQLSRNKKTFLHCGG